MFTFRKVIYFDFQEKDLYPRISHKFLHYRRKGIVKFHVSFLNIQNTFMVFHLMDVHSIFKGHFLLIQNVVIRNNRIPFM